MSSKLTFHQKEALLRARELGPPTPDYSFHDDRERKAREGLTGKMILSWGQSKATAKSLAAMGLVEEKFVAYIGTVFFVTEAGRAALRALTQEEKP